MFRATTSRRASAGFTLIEVLVALCIIAALFSSIAGLMLSAARGTRSIEAHLAELETARAIVNALPDRNQLLPRSQFGEVGGYRWRIDVSPLSTRDFNLPTAKWVPETVAVTVASPNGAMIRLDTVRLHRRTGG